RRPALSLYEKGLSDLEWGRSKDFDPAVSLRRRSDAAEVNRGRDFELCCGRLARAPVEGLTAAWRFQEKNPRRFRCDKEGVGHTARSQRDAARPNSLLFAVDVEEDFALQHI